MIMHTPMSMICLMLVATVSGQITYSTVKEGECDNPANGGTQSRYKPIDRAMCQAAAIFMNDDDQTCNDESEKDVPKKCYKKKNKDFKLMFNTKDSGTSSCSKDYQCLCATGCAIGFTTPTPNGCSPCISCSATQYESVPCLAWKPRVCNSCADVMNSVASILDGSCTACYGNKDGYQWFMEPGVEDFRVANGGEAGSGIESDSATCSAATCAEGFHTLRVLTSYPYSAVGCSECASACSETEYESTPCTPTTNRVCTSCAATMNDATGVADGSCTACIGSVSTTGMTSITCSAATCADGFHTYTNTTGCSECDKCSSTEYESIACTPTTNRVCTSCADTMNDVTSVVDGTCIECTGMISTRTGEVSQTTCSDATCAQGFHTYTNNGCSQCASECSDSEYESTPCTPTTNRVCTPCADIMNDVTSVVDGKCTACTGSASTTCSAATCAAEHHTFTNNGCSQCTPACSSTEYESTPCTPTTNRVCTPCASACSGSQYESTACSGSINRACTSCAAIMNAVTGVVDESCLFCDGAASTTCSDATCAEGFHTFVDGTGCSGCTTTCGSGTKFSACTTTADRTCPTCVAGSTWQDATEHSSTSCKPCTPCTAGTSQTAECTTTADRQCSGNTCTCLGGTPTVDPESGGSGATLCQNDGTVDCSACDESYIISETAGLGLQTCACPATKYAPADGTSCLPNTVCGKQVDGTSRAVGDASRTVAGTCNACTSNTYAADDATDCLSNIVCTGYQLTVAPSVTVRINGATRLDVGTCDTCAADTYALLFTDNCQANTVCGTQVGGVSRLDGATRTKAGTCHDCAGNTYAPNGGWNCEAYTVCGTQVEGGGTRLTEASPTKAGTCSDCAADTYAIDGETDCQANTVCGTQVSGATRSNTQNLPASRTVAGTCNDCAAGTYAIDGKTDCQAHTVCGFQVSGPQEAGATRLTGASKYLAGTCNDCAAGTYAIDGKTDCQTHTVCGYQVGGPQGAGATRLTGASPTEAGTCNDCAADTYASNGVTNCQANTVCGTQVSGATRLNEASRTEAGTCNDCASNTFGADLYCDSCSLTCGIGTYFDACTTTADRTCPSCAAGTTWQDATEHSSASCKSCTDCTAGTTMTEECTTTVDRKCTGNTCTCPGGTPTIDGGSGGTLCEADKSVDCSACDTGYTISETAGLGLQTCIANTCTATQVPNSDKSGSEAITGTTGSTTTVTCATGYAETATFVAECGTDGTFNAITCAAEACTSITTNTANGGVGTINTANGGSGNNKYTSDCDNVLSGWSCTLTCSAKGYSGTSAPRLCTAGSFATLVAPTCTADACTDNTPDGGSGNDAYTTNCGSSDVASGSSCTLTCSATGYSGSSTRLCTAGSFAALVAPTCTADPNPTCDNIDGSGADFASCVTGTNHLKAVLTGNCASSTCTVSDCCDTNPTCTGFDGCTDGTNHLKDSPGDSTCSTSTCQPSECCDANPTSCTAGKNGEECQNSGTPSGTMEDCSCQCAPGFTGDNCETEVQCEECQNGGSVVGSVAANDCACQCVNDFTGSNCQDEPSSPPDNSNTPAPAAESPSDPSDTPSDPPASPETMYLVSSSVAVVGMSSSDFNGLPSATRTEADPARIESFAQTLNELLDVAMDKIFNVRACGMVDGQAPAICFVSALADSDRDGTRRLDGEECAVFYEIGYASSSDASAGKASIEQMDSVEFTTKFIKAMNTNGVDSSVTSQVSTTPSKQSTIMEPKTNDDDDDVTVNPKCEDVCPKGTCDTVADASKPECEKCNDCHKEADATGDDNADATSTGDASPDSDMTMIYGAAGGAILVAIIAVALVMRNKKKRVTSAKRMSEIDVGMQMNDMESNPMAGAMQSNPMPTKNRQAKNKPSKKDFNQL